MRDSVRVLLLAILVSLPSTCFAQWGAWGMWAQRARLQRGQLPPICSPERMPYATLDEVEYLLDRLRDGDLEPTAWQRCAEPLLARMQPVVATEFVDLMGKAYRRLLRNRDLDQDPQLQAQLQVLHQIYQRRPNGMNGNPEVINRLLADLVKALAKNRLGPMATRYGRELLATVDLERGQWQGAAVDVAALDRILAQKDEGLLLHFAQRLPDPALRREARRRVVRLRLSALAFPELQTRSAEIEEVVLTQGRYPLPLGQYPAVRGSLDPRSLVLDAAVLHQNVMAQTVALLARSDRQQLLGAIPLRGALQVQVQGLAQPVTLCGPGGEGALDPTPCILAQDLRSTSGLAQVDAQGTLQLNSNVPMREALALLPPGATVSFSLLLGNTPVYEARWGVRFEHPKTLILQPSQAGQNGPNLEVQVDNGNPQRLLYQVSDGRATFSMVSERDEGPVRIASQGGEGMPGPSGLPGPRGHDGRSGRYARCPSTMGEDGENGGDGGNGGPGGDGGPGGNGGDVRVRVLCSKQPCEALVAQLRTLILSLAGPGGAAGSGGNGGSGGFGGSGGGSTSCSAGDHSYTLQSGRLGEAGRSGMPGPDGRSGRDGAPGRVYFQTVP